MSGRWLTCRDPSLPTVGGPVQFSDPYGPGIGPVECIDTPDAILRLKRFITPTFAVLSLAIATPASADASTAGNATDGMVEPVTLAIPAPPTLSTLPSSTWAEWSKEQQQAFESTHWTAAPGCTITSVSYSQVPVGAAISNVPPSAMMAVATIVGTCSAAATSSSSSSFPTPSSVPPPSATPAIPSGDTCGGITNGTECVGYGTNSRYALYQYLGSGTATGHDELSTEGALAESCYPGSLVGDGNTTTLSYGGEEEVLVPWNSPTDNVFDGTWWEGASPPYNDWGNVCTSI